MFKIKLLAKRAATQAPFLSEITIGNFTEQFAYYPFDRKITDIENYWYAKLKELMDGKKNIIFLRYDPRFAWAIYRKGGTCYLQNVLSVGGDFSEHLNRKIVTDDGAKISEWSTKTSMIKDFLKSFESE